MSLVEPSFRYLLPGTNKSGKEMKRRRFTSKAALLVSLRGFISLPDLFPRAPANRLWVSENGGGTRDESLRESAGEAKSAFKQKSNA